MHGGAGACPPGPGGPRQRGVRDPAEDCALDTAPQPTRTAQSLPGAQSRQVRDTGRQTPQRHEPAPHCGVSGRDALQAGAGAAPGPQTRATHSKPPTPAPQSQGASGPGPAGGQQRPRKTQLGHSQTHGSPADHSAAKPGARRGGTGGPASLWGRPARRTEDHRQVEPSPRSDHGTQAPAPVPEASASACPLGQVPGGPGGHRLPASKGSRSPSVFGGVNRHLVGN